MPRAQTLRDYQSNGVSRIFEAWRGGARRVLAVAPVGSGKTTIFSYTTAELSSVPVVILVHRRELATQAANRLWEFGVDFGMIMAGEPRKPNRRVQIASVQTLVRRQPPPAKLVICDEAHLSTAKTWQTILDAYPNARVLGFTATPWRLSGKPLAGTYDETVVIATPRELREQGHLCDYTGFSYLAPDLSKVETSHGEFNEKQSAAAMREPAIVANIVEQWKAHAAHLSTIVFAVNVEHSKALCEEFRAAGVLAEHLDGTTPKDQRASILRRVDQGQTRVLCNVGIAVEGLDIPRLKCIVDANPTKSVSRALQKWGRGRRPWQGQICRIHDHAFNIKRHGLPDAERDYKLDAKPERPESLTRCEECFAYYSGARCPACNHEPEVKVTERRELVTVDDAEIFEFGSGTEQPTTPEPPNLTPVAVTWNTKGRAVEGVFVAASVQPSSFGDRMFYCVQGVRRAYTFPGSSQLDALMARVVEGDQIRVTYLGEKAISGARWKKVFTVEVDDGISQQENV